MSLNPFTNRRKKQEEAVEEKQREQMQQLQQLQAQQYQMRAQQEASFAPPPSSGGFDLPKSSDDAYDISNLNQHLPASAQVDQEKPEGGWKMPSFGSGDVYGSYEAPSRMRSCFTKLQYGARAAPRRARRRSTPPPAAAARSLAACTVFAAAHLLAHRGRSPPRVRTAGAGFSLGAALGGAVGFAYGAFAAVKYKHVLYVPISVLQMGGAFGFFLMCGTVIRCDELPQLPPPKREEAQ